MEHNFDNNTSGIFLNFEGSRKIHPAIVCDRAGPSTIVDETGKILTVPAGIPRIHREGVGGRYGLRTDSSATNLLLYSQNLNHAHWITYTTNTNIIRDVVYGPNAKPMIGLFEDGSVVTPFVRRWFGVELPVNTQYSIQCVIAPGARRFVAVVSVIITMINGVRTELVSSMRLDTHTGEYQRVHANIENTMWRVNRRGDGSVWVGFSGSTPATRTLERSYIDVRPSVSTTLTDTPPVGSPYQTVTETHALSMSDLQLEINKTPTAYIPTTDTQVSRVAEHITLSQDYFNRIYNHDEGTIFCDSEGAGTVVWQLGIGTTSRVFLEFTKNSGTEGRLVVNNAETLFSGHSYNIRGRTAFTYKNGYYRFMDASGVIHTGGGGRSHAVPDTLRLGTSGSHQYNLNGSLYKLAYYPRSCSDEAMRAWVRS